MERSEETSYEGIPHVDLKDEDDVAVFATSSVELEADNEALHLGTRIPKELTEATARAISNNKGRSAAVRGDVIHLQHGTYGGKPATLLAFKFQFQFESNSINRFSRAEIRIGFDSNGINPNLDVRPAVKHFAPALICGPTKTGQVTKSIEVTPSISTPTLPVQAGIELSMGRSTTVARDFQMKIIGEPWASNEDAEDDDMVIWRVDENAAQADGIPRDLKTAVLVQHSGEVFQTTIQVKVRTRLGMSLFGWPWSKPTPLIISDKARFGKVVTPTTFDELDEKNWTQLVEFPGLVARIRVSDVSKEKTC